VTFESLNRNPKNRLTHITANGKRFHSDVDALRHISQDLAHKDNHNKTDLDLPQYLTRKGVLEFHMAGVDATQDWTAEPEHNLVQLRDQMCEALEQRYDQIYISYSGGTDSDTIADAFMRRGTTGVTLVNVANASVQKKTDARAWLAQHTGEAVKVKYADAISQLGWKVLMFEAWQPYDTQRYEKSLLDSEFMSWDNDFNNPNSWAQNSGEITLTRAAGRSCWIVGLEKPHLTIEDGWYAFQMHHNLFDTPLSCVDPNSELIYFWLNDLVPDLIKKMAHAKAKEMRLIFQDMGVLPDKQKVNSMNHWSSVHYHRLNRAMGLGGLTDFLMTPETKGGAWRSKDIRQQNELKEKHTLNKRIIRDRYFDEVVSRNVHHGLLDLKHRKPIGIMSKSIRLIPIQDK